MRQKRSDEAVRRVVFVSLMVIPLAVSAPWLTDVPGAVFWFRAGGSILLAATVLGAILEIWSEQTPP